MFKPKKLLAFLSTFLLLAFNPLLFAEDQITITTYYPSPYGSYNSLQTDKLGVGDNSGDGNLNSDDVPTATGDVWIKGKVGIGTINPSRSLHVWDGFIRVGSDTKYFETQTNGSYVDIRSVGSTLALNWGSSQNVTLLDSGTGKVGIGTAEPVDKLDVKDGYLALTDSDVAHGMTFYAPTSAYGRQTILDGAGGGLKQIALSDGNATAYQLLALIGSTNPTDSIPAIQLIGGKANGTGGQELAAQETVLTLQNWGNSLITVTGNGKVSIGTPHVYVYPDPDYNAKLVIDGGWTGVDSFGSNVGVRGSSTGGTGVSGIGGSTGVFGQGTAYGGWFRGDTYGIIVSSCDGCSVLAEMVPVVETPHNGDVMCMNHTNGKTEICREDKSRYLKGIAQQKAEQILRMGCAKTLDSKNGKNSTSIGVMDTEAWKKAPECDGWYPIALSGLSEETNVICKSPNGKPLEYGDILVTSNVPGRLRPLDKDENAFSYQVAGKADSICAPGKETDSIKVWIQ